MRQSAVQRASVCRENNYRRHVQEWRTGYGNSRPGLARWLGEEEKWQCHLRACLSCFKRPQNGSGAGERESWLVVSTAAQKGIWRARAYRSRNLALRDAKGRRGAIIVLSRLSRFTPARAGGVRPFACPQERTTCYLISAVALSGRCGVSGARYCSYARTDEAREGGLASGGCLLWEWAMVSSCLAG